MSRPQPKDAQKRAHYPLRSSVIGLLSLVLDAKPGHRRVAVELSREEYDVLLRFAAVNGLTTSDALRALVRSAWNEDNTVRADGCAS